MWALITRRNLLYLALFTMLTTIGALYSVVRIKTTETEVLAVKLSNITAKNESYKKEIKSLNTQVDNLIKDKALLEKTNNLIVEELMVSKAQYKEIENTLTKQSEFVLGNDENYTYEFIEDKDHQGVKVRVKTLTKDAKDKLSSIRIGALWDGYCHAYHCHTD